MGQIYIDEKGPQESFKISNPFSWEEKIAYGTDSIHGYVGNALYIPTNSLERLKIEYLELENNYLSKTQNPDRELKGSILLKGRVKYGVHSMREKDIHFYINLFQLLIKHKAVNLFFSVNKMSVILDAKLLEWIYLIDDKRFYPEARLLKYILTKYLDVEASKEVIEILLDENKSVRALLNAIQHDMTEIINENKNNKRMKSQIADYKEVVKTIRKTKHFEVVPSERIEFDWKKVTYALDLWLTEMNLVENKNSELMTLHLDEGINKKYFDSLNFETIIEGASSDKVIGLRLTDMLVVLGGNYIKNLQKDSTYDPDRPDKIKKISEEWFDISELQFNLIKLMNQFYFGGNQYSFVVDTYFDHEVVFESFISYVGSFNKFQIFKEVPLSKHVDSHFLFFIRSSRARFSGMIGTAKIIRQNYGSLKKAIESGDLRPI